ncbi:MAG: type II toxin-antitoxin system prevent-host-death family antitoxin [Algicola sp.]|nr:type II toxin-antitoxin system prevent-host-death family antitoxin [Algicola sp.]
MDAISYSNAQKDLAGIMQKTCDDHSPVMITHNNQDPVVVMSLADYQSMDETYYLLRSPVNAKILLESIAELESCEHVLSTN